MLPEICRIGPFTIYAYGLLLVIAFFVATYFARAQARKEQIDPELIFNLCFYVFIFGIVGSRVLYILLNFGSYLRHPLEIIMLQHGGMAWFGGLFFGTIGALWFIKKHNLNLLATLDLLAPFIALGQAIGRIGCLLNGCCYGRESQWGIYFRVFDKILIPTQIYSTLLLLLIFIYLRFKQNAKHFAGEIFCYYLLLYALKRFLVEFLRDDSARIFFGLTFFQILCLLVLFTAATIYTRLRLKQKK